jgi:hypothetical protein
LSISPGRPSVEISLKDETVLPYALATQLVVQVQDLQPAVQG